MRWKIADKLGATCLNDITCELANVTSACAHSRATDEEDFNTISRRKRETRDADSSSESRDRGRRAGTLTQGKAEVATGTDVKQRRFFVTDPKDDVATGESRGRVDESRGSGEKSRSTVGESRGIVDEEMIEDTGESLKRWKRKVDDNNVQYLTETLYVVEPKESQRPKAAKTEIEVHFQMIGKFSVLSRMCNSLEAKLLMEPLSCTLIEVES